MMHLIAALLLAVIPPAPTHFVTDLSHALSPQTASSVESQLNDYQQKTGHQVIVYVAPSTGGEALESFTSDAAHRWHVGQKGKDDGAILFLFTQDHKVRIEVGYGLESMLTDAKSIRIIHDDIVPNMKGGDADAAVQKGVNGILSAIDGKVDPQSTSAESGSDSNSDSVDGLNPFVFLVIFVIFPIGLFVGLGSLISHLVRKSLGLKPGQHLAYNTSGVLVSTTSSSDSGWGGGGGFSGGGGDFGGGGASGSW